MKAPTAKQKAAQAKFKKMIARAKQIRKASPNIAWKTAIKKAASEQR